jgi:hypothetical protein
MRSSELAQLTSEIEAGTKVYLFSVFHPTLDYEEGAEAYLEAIIDSDVVFELYLESKLPRAET